MFPAPRPRADPNIVARSREARDLNVAKQQARIEDARAVVILSHEVDDGAWEELARRAAAYENIDGRLPVETEHVPGENGQELPKPPAAAASEDQLLKDELLANDSLGG